MGYTKDALKGVSWIGLLKFSIKTVGFIEAIILARILTPEQFGAYGVALLALGLLEVLTETGVNTVLIQEQHGDEYISSAWVVSILRGIFIMGLLLLATPLIASFFHSQKSLFLLYLISIVPFLRGFINPSVMKLQKNMMFGKDFWYRFTILVIDTTVSITVTYLTKNPIGIVFGLLAGVFLELLLSFIIIAPLPTFSFKKAYVSTLFHKGKWVTASGIFDYLFFNTDNIIVGRLMGAAPLGLYQLAYSLSVVPLTELSNVFVHVTFPIFIKISTDISRLRKGYFKTVITIFLLTFPYVLVLIFLPHIFIFILGEKWSGIVPVLPILGILGIIKAVAGSSASLFLSEGKQNYITATTLVTILGLVVFIVPLVQHFGLVGAGTAALIGTLLSLPLFGFFIYRIFQPHKRTMLQ